MDIQKLNNELKIQNYSYVIQTLYTSNNNEAYEWALKKCDEGHIPLWYFLVRSYHISKFDNNRYDTIRQAFKMALKSLILSIIHISCCNEINKSFEIVNILSNKYDEKFRGYLTDQIGFKTALLFIIVCYSYILWFGYKNSKKVSII